MKPKAGSRVELDLFSGRPNPSWSLSADETAELVQRLDGLPPAQERPASGKLGYRGILISASGPDGDAAESIRVCRGVVSMGTQAERHHYRDTNQIETWLLAKAREQGFASIIDATIGARKSPRPRRGG